MTSDWENMSDEAKTVALIDAEVRAGREDMRAVLVNITELNVEHDELVARVNNLIRTVDQLREDVNKLLQKP